MLAVRTTVQLIRKHAACSQSTIHHFTKRQGNLIQIIKLLNVGITNYLYIFLSHMDRFSVNKYFEQRVKYKSYLNKLRTCTRLAADVCLNESKCSEKKHLKIAFISVRNDYCACRNHAFSYKCGRMHCTSNKKSCILFKNKLIDGTKYKSMNKCKK